MKKRALIVKRYVPLPDRHDLTELDLELYDWLGEGAALALEDGHDVAVLGLTERAMRWQGDAEPIALERLQDLLDEARKLGATHVEMFQHGDHNGYHAYPLEIRMGTAAETDTAIKKRAEEKAHARAAEIEELERRLAKLKET